MVQVYDNRMKTPMLLLIFCSLFRLHSSGQELPRKSLPLLVTHVSKANHALLRRKGSPAHTAFSKLICFKKKCRAFVGWRKHQRSLRFKGFRKGGALPPPKERSLPGIDTLIAGKEPAVPKYEERKRDQTFILDEVLFEKNSARLNEQFTFRLDSLVDILTGNRNFLVTITGHTDNTGNPAHNIRLSTDRARSVAEYLIESNVLEDRITYQGLGSSKPVASNETDSGRRKNRRVEILLTD